jgi:hypothetical protein
MDFKVPMRELRVQVALEDSAPSDYVIFLSPFSEHHAGFETLEEYLNGSRTFFPMVTDGISKIINRGAVIWVRTDTLPEANEEGEQVQRKRTTFELIDHSKFDGDVVIDRPIEQSRISDLLNDTSEHFIRVDADAGSYFINKRFIRAAMPK